MSDLKVAVIGAGVVGSAIARELSRHKANILVFEAGLDAGGGTSKANSGVVHSGINSAPGSLKARFCVQGNEMYPQLCKDLDVPVEYVGKFVVAKDENEARELDKFIDIGKKNGVPGIERVEGKDVAKKEPNVQCHSAIWVPSAGITLPYKLAIAMAENAAENGAEFRLDSRVEDIKETANGFSITTSRGEFQADIIINSAGIHCREVYAMLDRPDFHIYPCRGEYLVLDKEHSSIINSMVYPVPPEGGSVLGIHVTPTVEGPVLLGPSAEYVEGLEDKATTAEVMDRLLEEARELIPALPDRKAVIRAYSGIRCKLSSREWKDYRIIEKGDAIHLLGIESPGLTAAPAIAKNVVARLELGENKGFIPVLSRPRPFSSLSMKERKKLVSKDPAWGRVVCRCEHVTEAEVRNALDNPLGARTLSSVKFRTRAGMGRCQGGFCTQHIIRIMEELGMKPDKIKLKDEGSWMLTGPMRNRQNSKTKKEGHHG